jgi:tetratricopeptide (TPR) repeat protein/predicted Ser/Thr protein kinase
VSRESEALVGRRVGHYLLAAPLGEGGMGAVYLGFDELLERRVALKVLRGELRMDAAAKTRFLREARILSQLKHPHVCVVHDYLEQPDADFIVLELVEGQHLRKALSGGLSEPEKLTIAIQLAEVLAAVHARGVVHRDLKPENVMVTPEGEVKVLDFGLARSLSERTHILPGAEGEAETPKEVDASVPDSILTRAGTVMGTLGYMSPEQARGQASTEASDLYSFGLILQELFSGRPAFERGRAVEELLPEIAAGHKRPPSGLHPTLAALVEDLTTLDPGERIRATEALRKLREHATAPERLRRRRRAAGATAAIALAFVASAWIALRLGREGPLIPAGARGRVALLRFDNDTGDPSLDWIRSGLRGMVAETLAGVDNVEVVPDDRVDRAAVELDSGGAEIDAAGLRRLTELVGAEVAVAARFRRGGSSLLVDLRTTSRSGASGSRTFGAADPVAAAEQLADRLLHRLAPERTYRGLRETFSEDPFANRLYAMGVSAAQTRGAEIGRDFFRAALRVDPDLDWAHVGLADCANRLSEWDEEESEAEAVERRARAAEPARPRLLGASLVRRASVAIHRLDFDGAERLTSEALDLARSSGDAEGEAGALLQLGDIARRRERWKEAESYYQRSLEIHRKQGDRVAEVLGIHALGVSLLDQPQRLDEAAADLEKAIALERELHLRPLEARSLNSLAVARMRQDRLDEARSLFQQAADLNRELGDRRMVASTLSNLSVLEEQLGRWRDAIAHLEESYREMTAIDDREGSTLVAFNLALAYARTAQPDAARKYLEIARPRYGEQWEMLWIEARLKWLAGDHPGARALAARAKRLAGSEWESDLDTELVQTPRLDPPSVP